MFCRNCGDEISDEAKFCSNCGAKPLLGKKYCQECGAETKENQQVCLNCGVRLKTQAPEARPLSRLQLENIYKPTMNISVIPDAQKEEFKKHLITETFPTALVVLLHFLTIGLFSTIYFGLKHSKFPMIKEDDFDGRKAIGYLFIPLFNFYWVFVFWLRLIDRINFQFKLRNLKPPIPRNIAIAPWILIFTIFIPRIGIVTWAIGVFVLIPIMLALIQSACNRLVKISEQGEVFAPPKKAVATKPMTAKEKSNLIKLIIAISAGVLVIIGIIVVPTITREMRKTKQRETMLIMRNLSYAIKNYKVDFGNYPNCTTITELQDALTSFYIINSPINDSWENPFIYELMDEDEGYCLISSGRDGTRDTFKPYPERPQSFHSEFPSDFDKDIILCNGRFISYPHY